MVLLYEAGCLAAQQFSGIETYLFISIGCTIGVLVLLGLIAQICLPTFHTRLYRRKKNINHIINFAFTFGQRAANYLSEHMKMQRCLAELQSTVRRVPESGWSQSGQELPWNSEAVLQPSANFTGGSP